MFKTFRKNLAEDFRSPFWTFIRLMRQESIHVFFMPLRFALFPLTYFVSLFKSARKTLKEQVISIFCLEFSEDDLTRLEDCGCGQKDSIKVGTNFILFILLIISLIVSTSMGAVFPAVFSLICAIIHLIKFFFWMKNS